MIGSLEGPKYSSSPLMLRSLGINPVFGQLALVNGWNSLALLELNMAHSRGCGTGAVEVFRIKTGAAKVE
jgi:hypothetical protein